MADEKDNPIEALIVPVSYPGDIKKYWWTLDTEAPYLREACMGPFLTLEDAKRSLLSEFPHLETRYSVIGERHHADEKQMLWHRRQDMVDVHFALPYDEFTERVPLGLSMDISPERKTLMDDLTVTLFGAERDMVVEEVWFQRQQFMCLGPDRPEGLVYFSIYLTVDAYLPLGEPLTHTYGKLAARVSFPTLGEEGQNVKLYWDPEFAMPK